MFSYIVTGFIVIGVICIIICGTFLGAWTSGDRQRANYHLETKGNRDFRTKAGLISGGIAIIVFLLAGAIYSIT